MAGTGRSPAAGRRQRLFHPSRSRDEHPLRPFDATEKPRHGRSAGRAGDEALVGAYGRYHGREPRQLTHRQGSSPGVLPAMTDTADQAAHRPDADPGYRHVAVIDIGKTNAKVVVVDGTS